MDTYTQIYLMLVFGVKNRAAIITDNFRDHLHKTMAAIMKEHCKGCRPIIIGGTEDHVHIFFSFSPNLTVADIVRELKSRTSLWINRNRLTSEHFSWQSGYGAFNYSASSKDDVVRYVANQMAHHRKRPFSEEMRIYLEKFNVQYNPDYLPE